MQEGYTFLDALALQISGSLSDTELLYLVLGGCIEYTGATSGSLAIITDNGNRSEAARMLGINRNTLSPKLKST